MAPFQSIVIAFDGSGHSVHAVNVVLELALRFHSRVILLTVVPPPGPVYSSLETPPSAEEVAGPYRTAAEQQKTRLEKAGLTSVEVELLSGTPAREILHYIEQHPPDLLVMGARGLSELGRVFLGSVSDVVVHHAHCPIMVVRPPPSG